MAISAIGGQAAALSSVDFSGAAQAAANLTEESAQLEATGSDESVGRTVDTSA